MQTFFQPEFLQTAKGGVADRILRSCVHCGFCTATCPTFLLTGNELDSPRGRIYLIKEMLEGGEAGPVTRTHLDRCLSCQSCETTCPSGVRYHTLLDIGRGQLEKQAPRSTMTGILRYFMRKLFTSSVLFASALKLGRLFRPAMPSPLKKMIPVKQDPGIWPVIDSQRRMIVMNGCVQQTLSPSTNYAVARVLGRLGIKVSAMAGEGCCGAVSYHLNAQDEGLAQARHNIDLICEQLDQGVETIISTASGCGNFSKDYVNLFMDDGEYAGKARRVVRHLKDISEVLMTEDLAQLKPKNSPRLAFHCPCSLQHGHRLNGAVESILARLDVTLTEVRDSHLCCGSAGTYSILQPELAKQLQSDKIMALDAGNPDAIATANIGCQTYLGAATDKPVKHWIEYVDEIIE